MGKDLMQVFSFNETQIRTVVHNSESWFVAKDVCDVLEISNVPDAVSRLDNEEKLMSVLPIAGQNRNVSIINESGLYSLILTSRKPEAKLFKKWITSEVIPSIRKTGSYFVAKQSRPEIEATTIFKSYHSIAKLIGLDKNQAALAANNAAKSITGTDTLMLMGASHLLAEVQEVSLTPTEIGQEMGKTGFQVNKLLETKGLQKRFGNQWEPTETGKKFSRLFDTGKKHSTGVPITQLKWFSSVIQEVTQ